MPTPRATFKGNPNRPQTHFDVIKEPKYIKKPVGLKEFIFNGPNKKIIDCQIKMMFKNW